MNVYFLFKAPGGEPVLRAYASHDDAGGDIQEAIRCGFEVAECDASAAPLADGFAVHQTMGGTVVRYGARKKAPHRTLIDRIRDLFPAR